MAQSISQEAIGATGLPGATAASRHAGATASGAPTTGTFAVGDFIIDQTGKVYVCTVAGTPGTWVQTGGGTYAPGTTVSSFITADVAVSTANTNITSISLTAGTWLINYQAMASSGGTANVPVLYLSTASASFTGQFAGIEYFISTGGAKASASGCSSFTCATTTTVFFNNYIAGSYAMTINYQALPTAGSYGTGITAVRTA